MALLSFGGQLLDNDGKVIADQPKNREAIVKTLAWFGEMYNSGYVPARRHQLVGRRQQRELPLASRS